ncbi:MAG: N-acetylmuramoyl-L-alanine amidase [Pseudomonadales bacterium]
MLLSLAVGVAQAKQSIESVRIWLAPDNTRLVFDLTGPVKHKIFALSNPSRVVLDIEDVSLKAELNKVDLSKSPIAKLRSGKGEPLRIVLDLKQKVSPKSFLLKPNSDYGHRLVVDLAGPNPNAIKKPVPPTSVPPKPAAQTETPPKREPATTKSVATKPKRPLRDIVIALDAGHGGKDPGALGPSGLREKEVVLGIAKELEKLIDAQDGFISRMIRRNDHYVNLRARIAVARKKRADLFVSIHADAFTDKRAKGASVWVLSNRGASSELGRRLAQKENSSDLIGGVGTVSLDDKDAVLRGVLLDMSMSSQREDSTKVASKVHNSLSRITKMHKPRVERAGFLVLKSPDIPSILVETGFISNPDEERALKQSSYRKKLAQAIFKGIQAHFLAEPPEFTKIYYQKYGDPENKPLQHQVVRGDSLSRIASRYGVSMNAIKVLNKINSNTIKIGQRLQIPAG